MKDLASVDDIKIMDAFDMIVDRLSHLKSSQQKLQGVSAFAPCRGMSAHGTLDHDLFDWPVKDVRVSVTYQILLTGP